jgi:hypothetical protein
LNHHGSARTNSSPTPTKHFRLSCGAGRSLYQQNASSLHILKGTEHATGSPPADPPSARTKAVTLPPYIPWTTRSGRTVSFPVRFTIYTLFSARGDVVTPTWQQPLCHTAHLLPLSAQYTAPCTEPSNGLHQSRRRLSVTCLSKRLFEVHSSQAKASQSVNWGAQTYSKRKSTSPCVLAIPAFDRLAGFDNRHLNSNGGICLR